MSLLSLCLSTCFYFSLSSLTFLFFLHLFSPYLLHHLWRLCHALSPPPLFVSVGLILIDHSHRSKPLLCLRSRYHREQDGDVNETFLDASVKVLEFVRVGIVEMTFVLPRRQETWGTGWRCQRHSPAVLWCIHSNMSTLINTMCANTIHVTDIVRLVEAQGT